MDHPFWVFALLAVVLVGLFAIVGWHTWRASKPLFVASMLAGGVTVAGTLAASGWTVFVGGLLVFALVVTVALNGHHAYRSMPG